MVEEEVKPIPQETNSTAESVPVTTEKEEQMVTIPKSVYDELVKANDDVFLAVMTAYDKFDEIIGNVMNLNTIVFNKKKELKTLIFQLGKEKPVDSIK